MKKEICETCVWWDEDLKCLKITLPHEKSHCQDGKCIYYVKVKED